MLGLGCGSGLALVMAASRGAAVTGVEPSSPERLALARQRLLPEGWDTHARADARLVDDSSDDLAAAADVETQAEAHSQTHTPAYTLVTAFEPIGCLAGDSEGLGE
ncbi:class I SAM-dependent methyltransferase, partial [Streptomyces sp. T21Q-yed]|uniref:methyltransferase domain-containing protein n=1 Tax=Streptomyces sp. T21Q-yed TaxID=3018441 RepID=UPI0023DE9316